MAKAASRHLAVSATSRPGSFQSAPFTYRNAHPTAPACPNNGLWVPQLASQVAAPAFVATIASVGNPADAAATAAAATATAGRHGRRRCRHRSHQHLPH